MNFIPGVNLVFCLSALWSSAMVGEQLSKPSFQGIQRIKEMNLSDITSVIMKINRPLVKVKALRGIIGDYQVHPNTICSAGDRSCLWPSSQNNNIYIPYVFQSNYKRAQRELISTALSELESLTCIRFKYRSREVTYLVFIDGIGSRSDRDDHVEVKMENVEKGSEINFKVKKSNNLVTKYDYNSVLHFGRYAFSKSPGLPTIVPKLDPNVYLGQLMGLSETDILKINKLYQCKICGNLLTENYRYFTSPSFPNLYPDHANCKWMIRAPWHHKIVLEFDFFHIQPFLGCYRDNLKIYDGSTTHSPVLKGPVCGKIAPAVISSHHLLLIAFSSGHYKHSKGFSAKYRFVNCGRMLITSPSKIIGRFEHRGSINPNESSNCFWLVQAHKGHEVVFEITTYNFQRSDNCTFAYLKIHDVSQAPPANRGKFCGATPVPLTEGTALLLEFNHPGAQMQPGLRVDYKCVIRPFERRGRSSVRWNAQCDAFMLVWCILINSAWIV
ncbi:embryonic protein UVS.2-like isoform X1 [Hemitrygon akajei]|uniref:embryonic protein UVS.2-like isoform X1 n=1 Tax=Hemitrygon akajei TaxID=2704970 RepID=UPI003BF95395